MEEYSIEEDLEEAYKEIKRLNKIIEKYDNELKLKTKQYEYLRHFPLKKYLTEKNTEIERLHSIIKEVRELLKNDYFEDGSFTNYYKVFELLDKE